MHNWQLLVIQKLEKLREKFSIEVASSRRLTIIEDRYGPTYLECAAVLSVGA